MPEREGCGVTLEEKALVTGIKGMATLATDYLLQTPESKPE